MATVPTSALCKQWQADPNSPLYSGNPVTMANAELSCLYGPNGYVPVRSPFVSTFPGSGFGPMVATATAPNPILGTSSQQLNPGQAVNNPSIQLTPGQVAANAAPNGVITLQDLFGNTGGSPYIPQLVQDFTGPGGSSNTPAPGAPNPLTGIPGWVWILIGAVGVIIVVKTV